MSRSDNNAVEASALPRGVWHSDAADNHVAFVIIDGNGRRRMRVEMPAADVEPDEAAVLDRLWGWLDILERRERSGATPPPRPLALLHRA